MRRLLLFGALFVALVTLAHSPLAAQDAINAPGTTVGTPQLYLPAMVQTDICLGVSEIPAQECRALVTLYRATGGPNWDKQDGWLESTSPCTWFGITCAGGHVTHLNLLVLVLSPSPDPFTPPFPHWLGNNLRGTLPAQLGDLRHLQSIRIYGNPRLTGPIPATLGNLTGLTNLSLEANSLTGPIPAALGNLTNLESLVISNNALSGALPPELGNLENLTTLWIHLNRLSGPIPGTLGNLARLDYLDLSANALTGPIPTELGNLSALTYLSLADNHLTGPVPGELGNLTALHHLHLEGNQLYGELPATLNGLTNLGYLDLSRNYLIGHIPTTLGELSLAMLHLDDNGPTLCIGWETLVSLRANGLSQFTMPPGDVCIANRNFCDTMTQISFGECLGLAGLATTTNVRELYPEWMVDEDSCRWRGVQCQQQSDGRMQVVAVTLTDPPFLTGALPANLDNIGFLRELDLHGGQLTGTIPPRLGDLWNLSILDLADNDLEGEIPAQLGGSYALHRLDLSGNHLWGAIPPELGDSPVLQVLDLSDNGLGGTVPVALGNLSQLTSLDLHGNAADLCLPAELNTFVQSLANYYAPPGGICPSPAP